MLGKAASKSNRAVMPLPPIAVANRVAKSMSRTLEFMLRPRMKPRWEGDTHWLNMSSTEIRSIEAKRRFEVSTMLSGLVSFPR